MGETKIEGVARLRKKVLDRFPDSLKREQEAANQKSADEFEKMVRAIIPKGDPKDGNLADSLRQFKAFGSEIGVAVGIGDEAHPYPLHLEAGHRAADGSHVPGKPFWNPSKRVMAKRVKARATRATNKVVKAMVT